MRLALFPVPFEPAAGRGNAVGAWHRRVLRNDAQMGPQVRRGLREAVARKKSSRKYISHLDEVVISIGGRKHWLWRAVDQDRYVLDEIVQAGLDTRAARRLLVRLLRKQGLAPQRIITDKLRSYGAARRNVMPGVEHRSHKGLNYRAENSQVPLRKRERIVPGFRTVGGLQRFISVYSAVRNLFVPPHHRRSSLAAYIHRTRAMAQWKAVTSAMA